MSTHPDLSDEFPSFNVALDLVFVDEGLWCLGLILNFDAPDKIGVPFWVSGEVEELWFSISTRSRGRFLTDPRRLKLTTSRTLAGGAAISILLSFRGILSKSSGEWYEG